MDKHSISHKLKNAAAHLEIRADGERVHINKALARSKIYSSHLMQHLEEIICNRVQFDPG